MLTLVIVSDDNLPSQTVKERYVGDHHNPTRSLNLLINYLAAVAGGSAPGKVLLFQDSGDGTQAAGNIACTQANATAGDTVTIAGVVFTVRASPSSEASLGEFAAGASDTAMAANLAAAINAHPALKGVLTAAGSVGNCALTAVDKGTQGNLIVMSTSDATAFGLTQFASGAKGTVKTELRAFRRGV